MKNLTSRLTDTLALLDHADAVMSEAGHDDDGKVRSLLNDLRWLRDRYADRLRIERETTARKPA